jgi:hypothetical protein
MYAVRVFGFWKFHGHHGFDEFFEGLVGQAHQGNG